MNCESTSKHLPSFIEERLESFFIDLIKKNEDQKHLVLGKMPSQGSVMMQSTDYLSLSQHPDICFKHKQAIDKKDENMVMSAIFIQTEQLKPVFENQMADFMGMESCLLSTSGWSANIGLLQMICAPKLPVYIDFLAHRSLLEGARIAGAHIHPFKHNDVTHLRKQIKRYGVGLIVVDSVYSTIGSIAPLEAIYEMAEEFGCGLLVDESHSLGTHGPQGSGLISELGLRDRVDFVTASLAKAFAYRAGVILGPKSLTRILPFVSYPAIFSSRVLSHEIVRLEATLEVIREADEQRKKLYIQSRKLRAGLKHIGFNIRSNSQIIALECRGEENTLRVRDFLEKRDVFGSVFCRPATGKNKNIIRFSMNSDITDKEITYVLKVCKAAFTHSSLEFK